MADIKLRTKEELLLPDYNYYIFFKIEPTEKDVSKIEKSILMERNKWTQGQPIQRRYRELYPDVERVMLRDEGRARELELANAKKLKLDKAKKLCIVMARRGFIFKSELMKIKNADRFEWYSILDLENELHILFELGIKYIDDTQFAIDFRKYKEIEKNLISVKKGSLYEVIEGTPTDSVETLTTCIYTIYSNLKNKMTPEGAATDRLLGISRLVFKTEESKVAYDEYLAVKEKIWDELSLRQELGIHEITLKEFQNYADIMSSILGIKIDQAEERLSCGCKEFKLAVSKDNYFPSLI